MNCLAYALRFWKRCLHYKLWYNSDHVINLPERATNDKETVLEFLRVEEFGYEYFRRWYDQQLINEEELQLLKQYFNK